MSLSLRGVVRKLRRALSAKPMDEAVLVSRVLADRRAGVMIDVGAHHGGSMMPFAKKGWSVHAFEPDASNRAILEESAAGFSNVVVLPYAVGDQSGELVLYASAESSGISSLSAFADSHRPSDRVKVTTLAEYMAGAGITHVTFLKIDVEGWEQPVLAGYPWHICLPEAILLEFEDRKTLPLGYGWRDLAETLREKGYEVLISEWFPIVAYGTLHRWRAFRGFPAELADAAAWGNLVAVRPELEDRLMRAARREALRHRFVGFAHYLVSRRG